MDKSGVQDGAARGEKHYAWKGKDARHETQRARAQRMYHLGICEGDDCQRKAADRHHKDADTNNNHPDNIKRLCRRCHMKEDGRLEKFLSTCAGLKKRKQLERKA